MKPKYTPYEERILRVLARGRRELTTLKVSEFSGISYNSTKSNLEKLYKKKLLTTKKMSNKRLWGVKE